MIESLRTTQIAFFRFATLCGFFRGSADEVQKVSVQGLVQEKLIWNHLWEHCFSVPDPRVFPPPGDHFLTPTTESPFYDWAHRQPSKKESKVNDLLSKVHHWFPVGKTPNTTINSFGNNVAKQVARFCCPFNGSFRYLQELQSFMVCPFQCH